MQLTILVISARCLQNLRIREERNGGSQKDWKLDLQLGVVPPETELVGFVLFGGGRAMPPQPACQRSDQ